MTKSLEYFFPDKADGKVEEFEVVASNRFKDENGDPIPWKFRLMTAKEINKIQEGSLKNYNISGRPTKLADMEFLKSKAILDSIIFPNLKDKDLQDAYGAMSDRELLDCLLEGRELERLGSKVLSLQGIVEGVDDLIGEAKN